ncbi:MAG: VanW family protein [Caldilineaceae bacterium]|nr:VanW family protein [Caldilineaceae bacterium]
MQTTLPTYRARPVPFRRSAGDFVAIWAVVAALSVLAAVAGWQFWHTDRIFTGVQVAGVPVGGMTRSAAILHLSRELRSFPVAPLPIEFEDRTWTLSSDQFNAQPDLLAAVNAAYLIGRQGNAQENLSAQWRSLLGQQNISPALTFDESAIRYAISQIAADVRRPGQAQITIGDMTLPSAPGVDVGIDNSTRLVLARLQSGDRRNVVLQTAPVAPPDAQASAADAAASRPPALPLIVQDEASGLVFALDPATRQRLLPNGPGGSVNEAALEEIIDGWAKEIYVPAQDARLRFDVNAGRPVVIKSSMAGRQLNVEATIAAIRGALESGQNQAPLPVEAVAPKVDANRIDEMGIRELVANGTTYFAGSSLARIRNIEVAAEKFEGVVIPPNGIFSFNSIVQDVSAANGFEDSLIIWGDRTAVGVGGGVCQVSTTAFRSAFLAGFPIVERYNHGYVVSWYGEPGMDATIYTPSVDFKFRNDTSAYLLVQPVVDSVNGTISFLYYGTKPDRQVTVSQPIISDVVEAGDPVYQEDESLAVGQIRQVETAKNGLTVTVERTIVENGQSRVDKIVSVYQPWSAVFLVGPGTPIPGQEQSTTP